MKVVIDTNIFISGIFWEGNSNKIINLWRNNRFSLITSTLIIEELVEVLNDFKIKLPENTIKEWTDLIIRNSIIVEPKEKIDVIIEDVGDNKFLEAAVEGKADYIISQDKKHLLVLKKFRNIQIISPEEALKLL